MSSCHLTYLIEAQFTVTVIETEKLWRKKVLLLVTRLRIKVKLLVWIYGYERLKKGKKQNEEIN